MKVLPGGPSATRSPPLHHLRPAAGRLHAPREREAARRGTGRPSGRGCASGDAAGLALGRAGSFGGSAPIGPRDAAAETPAAASSGGRSPQAPRLTRSNTHLPRGRALLVTGVRAHRRAHLDRERGARPRQDWFPPPGFPPAPPFRASPLPSGSRAGGKPSWGAPIRLSSPQWAPPFGLPAATAPLSQAPQPPGPGLASAALRAPSAARPSCFGGQGRPWHGSPRLTRATASAAWRATKRAFVSLFTCRVRGRWRFAPLHTRPRSTCP